MATLCDAPETWDEATSRGIFLPTVLARNDATHTANLRGTQARKRSNDDLLAQETTTAVVASGKINKTARDHGHMGGLLAGKIGSNKFVVRTATTSDLRRHPPQADYAVDGRSKCRLVGCKQPIAQNALRLGKIPPALK